MASERLNSLDAYRGATMLYMASEIWRLPALAKLYPDNPIWQAISFQTSHVAWEWGSAWDMIQPSFMFMVGVALPWSVANRRAQGQGLRQLWLHAVLRSFILMALGIVLRSVGRPMTNFTFEDVLTQIGLGYPILFLLAWVSMRMQAAAGALILVGYWAAFMLFPAEGWHWAKNANLAHFADQWFLNLFPREKLFEFNGGGYQTLNFVPALGTMICGLLAGGVLRSARSARDKLRTLVGYGLGGIVVGAALGLSGVCPVIKRIWTPSWTLFSSGWVALILAGFYWLIDVRGIERWSRPVRAVGMNSIAMYVMAHLWGRFLGSFFQTNFGWNVLSGLSAPWLSFVSLFLGWCVLWWCCLWLDRKRLYLRI
jgi:predicted acyltransferase